MKITHIEAATVEDATQQISELTASVHLIGDQIVVTYPDETQGVFVFLDTERVVQDYTIIPDGRL
uniref:Uncharacterized protein n=1 Tax=viral metagenome TaxID=1070528 RepID=A0A6M3Y0S8_9ZZZZ